MLDQFQIVENVAGRIIVEDQVFEPHLSCVNIIGTINPVNDPV